eukprot:snap_masked-scaffold_1-processed-gene-21.41-mRNA-1 protein AED:1.00 eAED:1.00 QI:0/0/0/0/1/1/2/0/96
MQVFAPKKQTKNQRDRQSPENFEVNAEFSIIFKMNGESVLRAEKESEELKKNTRKFRARDSKLTSLVNYYKRLISLRSLHMNTVPSMTHRYLSYYW